MAKKRFYIDSMRDSKQQLQWFVFDEVTGKIAKGTRGAGGRPGGYEKERDAEGVRDRLNRAHEEVQREQGKDKR